ncbi:cupin domain-containing protein [Ovoidimarina sediminis]|uniref:cupin domain-containing protein n=1 Tax=Ovoidimarina sediminis TaxID=3079856 RepID=UPI002910421B|nr:cupin domain-containing protein [Rhodophyticola sp. MJ-SS7]MDU8945284.1 cupin domain-containing protein [Rhodophyticola sp. MJ-SS7]
MCEATGTATGTVLIENETVRVTEWHFAREGDNTGWHRHEFDYVVVPLFDGQLRIEAPRGQMSLADLRNGVPYYRNAGVEHDVINANPFPCRFIEVEIL